jgi:tripartite-type tricarboxylate transporter receptor subunit TctC
MKTRLSLLLACAMWLFAGAGLSAAFAGYPDPTKHITLIVPFSAGGSNDILARFVGRKMSDDWHVSVVIVNVVGASGALGAERVARSDPDGYTILMLSSTFTINSAVMDKLPYDPDSSFAGAALLGKAPMMLAVSKSVPISNAKELIALARANPGTLNYGSAGAGSVNQMAMELMKKLGNLDIKHVPYRAGNEAVNDLLGGHLDMFIGSLPQMMALTHANTATAIAVTSSQRSSIVPEVPTLAEAGIPGYELEQWWGIVVPAGTPEDIIAALNTELNSVMNSTEVKAFMDREGARATPSTPAEFDQHLHAELQRWRTLVQKSN